MKKQIMRKLGFALPLAILASWAQANQLPFEGTWRTSLIARDINQDGVVDAYYDTALDVTWQANPYLPTRNSFGIAIDSTPGLPITMSWDKSQEWISAMNSSNYLGFSDWRLPRMTNPLASCNSTGGGGNCGGADFFSPQSSEFAHLMFVTLGVTGLSDKSPFDFAPAPYYWMDDEYSGNSSEAWVYEFRFGGYQLPSDKSNRNYTWAVRSGDVLPVPEPSSLSLGALGALGLAALYCRKNKHQNQKKRISRIDA